MNAIVVIFITVCVLWAAAAVCIIYMIIDIMRMKRERREIVARMQYQWYQGINQRGPTGMRWRAVPDGDTLMIRTPIPQPSPEADAHLFWMAECRDIMMRNAMIWGTGALRAAHSRCDICGAMTPDQKTERCRNACGQIHGGKTTAIPVLDASSWTGRSDGRGGLLFSRRNDLRGT